MGTSTRTHEFAVAQETVAVPVPICAQVLNFSLKVPIAPFSVRLAPAVGHDTMTLAVAVPAATVLFEAGFHRHSAIVLAVVSVAEPPVVNERPVPDPMSVE